MAAQQTRRACPYNRPMRPSGQPSQPLHILVADDTATNRQILSVFLGRHGHRVDLVEDGAQAVERFAQTTYDMVIMDVMMPVMDGYEATRRIKAACGSDRWVPVIFLSALDNDANLVAGLEAGGDDYLYKPVNFVVLEAKLRALSRALLLRRELEETRRVLQVYHDDREAENSLAAEIFEQIMQRPGLSDPLLSYWMNPASHFSGDIVAATRAPDGRLFVLLADATGHGLAAAISVLPVLTLFYDIAEQGPTLDQLVAKINNQIRQALPVGRFTCCACLCVDPQTGRSEFWNGGLPDALLIDAEGRMLRRIPSRQLPLGIVDFDAQACAPEPLPVTPGAQLVLISDGVIEALNAQGEAFGFDRLAAALAGVPPANRLAAIKDAILEHVDGRTPHDDVTIMLVDLTTPQETAR